MLTNHNYYKYFINVLNFNGRQARLAIKLFIFDFVISHKSNKSNLIDAPSKRPNYKNENEFMNKFLLTLQQKLVLIKNLTDPVFKIIKTIYGPGAYKSHVWRNHCVAFFSPINNATVSNEKKKNV